MNSCTLKLDEQNSLEVFHQGAHATAWRCNGIEQLFVSDQARYQSGKAIRGGVPLIFPQFDSFGPGMRHGFARTTDWQRGAITADSVTFLLGDNEATRKIWPHSFSAQFSATLSPKSLTMCLSVTNTGTSTCEFTAALHTYFRIAEISETRITGLQGMHYWDSNKDSDFSQRFTDNREEFSVTEMIDRVYFDVDKPIHLKEAKQQRMITSTGFNDVVVWNPWLEGAMLFPDMADEEYRHMLCIESAIVDQPQVLAPKQTWTGQQKIIVN